MLSGSGNKSINQNANYKHKDVCCSVQKRKENRRSKKCHHKDIRKPYYSRKFQGIQQPLTKPARISAVKFKNEKANHTMEIVRLDQTTRGTDSEYLPA